MAFQVCRIVVDCLVRHCTRRIVVEEAANIRTVVAVAGAVDSHSFAVVEEVRNSVEVDSSSAGVGTAEAVVLHILRGIQILGILTFLMYRV